MSLQGSLRARAALPIREQQHRRLVLLGMGLLIALGASPVFGHHVAGSLEPLLLGRDHVLNLCLVALHAMFAPVHDATHVLFFAGVVYAVADRGRALWNSQRTLALLATSEASSDSVLLSAARESGITNRVFVVRGLPVPAFTSGWWKPRIYVAADLTSMLEPEEVRAVIAHEASHVRRFDPLRLSLLRFLACALFFVPVLRRLADDAADEAEIVADDDAARLDALALASAIVKLAEASNAKTGLVPGVGFQRTDLMDRRVRRLLGLESHVGTHVTRRSLGGAAAVLSIVWISGLLMVHPMPDEVARWDATHSQHAPVHCRHHGVGAWTHLFCRGLTSSTHTGHCPHADR